MNNTLTNGLALLQYLATTPRPYGVTELSEQLSLPKSHVHRLLQTLYEAKYVEKHRAQYKIGIGALRLGHALLYDMPVRRIALPLMQAKAVGLNQQLTLALPFGDDALSVADISPDGSVKSPSFALGAVLKAGYTASGKLFSAYRTAEEQSEVATNIDWGSLAGPKAAKSEIEWKLGLKDIATQGYSINNEETTSEAVSMAVAIFHESSQPLAALGASDLRKNCPPETWGHIIEQLKNMADEIQTQLKEQ